MWKMGRGLESGVARIWEEVVNGALRINDRRRRMRKVAAKSILVVAVDDFSYV